MSEGRERRYYTVDEAAAILECSPRAIYEMVRSGRLRSMRLGRGRKGSRIRIPRQALETEEVKH